MGVKKLCNNLSYRYGMLFFNSFIEIWNFLGYVKIKTLQQKLLFSYGWEIEEQLSFL